MKKVLVVFLAITFSVVASAQINLSGNWALNAAKSTLNDQFSLAPKMCIVSQNDSTLIIEKKLDFQGQGMAISEKFYLDGRDCINSGIMESVKKSKVTFSEDKKSIKITSQIATNDIGEISLTEQYYLDNENLIYSYTSSSSSFGEMSETAVYTKN